MTPPAPLRGNTRWVDLAACKDTPPQWWFPPTGDRQIAASTAAAKATCARCPVLAACLDDVMTYEHANGHHGRSIRYGTTAGLTPQERDHLEPVWLTSPHEALIRTHQHLKDRAEVVSPHHARLAKEIP